MFDDIFLAVSEFCIEDNNNSDLNISRASQGLLRFKQFLMFSLTVDGVWAPMAMTASPVSNLKRLFRPLTPSWAVQSPPLVKISLRNKTSFPSSCLHFVEARVLSLLWW